MTLWSERRRAAWIAAAAGALVYANALALGFAYDDVPVIKENPALHSWSGVLGSVLQPYWTGRYGAASGLWRPVTSVWWGLQWLAWGDRPALFHAMGVLLHAAVSALLVLVLAELLPIRAAMLAGLLFALHPVHLEAVANVAGNAEALAALFALLACWCHLRSSAYMTWPRALAIGALFALAALTKEIAFTLPTVLFLLDAARRDVRVSDLRVYLAGRWRVYLVLAAATAGLLLARADVLGGIGTTQFPSGAGLLADVSRVWTVPDLWSHYVRLLLFPADLSPEYGGIIPVEIGWGVRNLTGVAIALAFLGLAWWAWREGPPLAPDRSSPRVLGFAVVWFGLTVLPVANVVFQTGVLLAERNLYLPSVGMAAACGWLLAGVIERRRVAGWAIVAAVAGLFSLRVVTATPRWRTTEALFADLFERHPEVGKAWLFHADLLFKQGRQAEARHAFSQLLLLSDSEYTSATEVGARLSAMDGASPRAAEFLLERAWRERPDYYTAPGYLAAHCLNHSEFAMGEPAARAALVLAPDNLDMERVLAGLLTGQGRAAEAIPYRVDAIRRGGSGPWRQWVWLADDYLAVGDTALAGTALDSARVRSPDAEVTAAIDARKVEIGVVARTE